MDDPRNPTPQPYQPPTDVIDAAPPEPRKRDQRGSTEPQPGRCAAKLRRSNPPRYCMRIPCAASKRCDRHGGHTPKGVASPHFKTGLRTRGPFDYGQVLGQSRLGQLYAHARTADDPLSTKQQIALYEGLVAETAAALVVGEHVPKDAIDAWADVEDAQSAVARTADGSVSRQAALARMSAALTRVGSAMREESRRAAARAELDRRNLVLDRLKRTDLELQETRFRAFTAEQAFALIGSVAALVKAPIDTHIADPLLRRAVLRDVAAGLAALAARRPDSQPARP